MKRLACLFLLAGCAGTPVAISTAPASMTDAQIARAIDAELSLYDPESVQLRDVRHFRSAQRDALVCGEFNARNRLGGYVGFQPFLVKNGVAQPAYAANVTCPDVSSGSAVVL